MLRKDLKDDAVFYIFDNKDQPVDTVSGVNTKGFHGVHWHTWNIAAGTYKVTMKAEKSEMIRFAVLKPPVSYRALNYSGKE